MSMISVQVDELRELATRCDELQVGAVKAVTMPSDMGSILRDAADTIWQLRDDLQRANAENAKLRERSAKTLEVCTRWMAKAARFESENTKLRELIREYHRFADAMCAERDCDGCSQRDEGACERGVLTSWECVLGMVDK